MLCHWRHDNNNYTYHITHDYGNLLIQRYIDMAQQFLLLCFCLIVAQLSSISLLCGLCLYCLAVICNVLYLECVSNHGHVAENLVISGMCLEWETLLLVMDHLGILSIVEQFSHVLTLLQVTHVWYSWLPELCDHTMCLSGYMNVINYCYITHTCSYHNRNSNSVVYLLIV